MTVFLGGQLAEVVETSTFGSAVVAKWARGCVKFKHTHGFSGMIEAGPGAEMGKVRIQGNFEKLIVYTI